MKVEFKVPYVKWRNGQPLYTPSPTLRERGEKSKSLRHRNGDWFSKADLEVWWRQEERRIRRLLADKPAKDDKPVKNPIGRLLTDFLQDCERRSSPAYRGHEPMAVETCKGYLYQVKAIEAFDNGRIWKSPAEQMTTQAAHGIYEAMVEQRSLAAANKTIRTFSAAWSWATLKPDRYGVTVNPFYGFRLKHPKTKLRRGTDEEMFHLIRAADLIGRPEIGDCIVLGMCTGQRQADRLDLSYAGQEKGRFVFTQRKTGAEVDLPVHELLQARLDASRERRKGMTVSFLNVIIDEVGGKPFKRDWYNKVFARVRKAAVEGIISETGEVLLQPMPSLADFEDNKLRATAITKLADGSATEFEVISVSGHSLASATNILKHYSGPTRKAANSAIAKMDWKDPARQGEAEKNTSET